MYKRSRDVKSIGNPKTYKEYSFVFLYFLKKKNLILMKDFFLKKFCV